MKLPMWMEFKNIRLDDTGKLQGTIRIKWWYKPFLYVKAYWTGIEVKPKVKKLLMVPYVFIWSIFRG